MSPAVHCEKCWYEEHECQCRPCAKCGKDLPPNEQYGDFSRPWCTACHESMTALVAAEKQRVAQEQRHFPTDLNGKPLKAVL